MNNKVLKTEKEKFNKFSDYIKGMYDKEEFSSAFSKYILYMYFENVDVEESLYGLGSNDEGVDAFVVNDNAKKIYLIQFKSKKHYDEKGNKDARKEWFSLIDKFTYFDDKNFHSKNKRIKDIINLLSTEYKDYSIVKQIYHMGYCSEDILKNYENIDYFNMSDILEKFVYLYEEDMDDENAPEKIEIKVEVIQDRKINSSNDLIYFTPKARNGKQRSTVTFPLSGDKIIEILKRGTTILERNVRGFLGDKNIVNKGIIETALNEPEYFYFFNNGISITCNKLDVSGLNNSNNKKLTLYKPQIINGAQTVNSLKVAFEKKLIEFKKLKSLNPEQDALNFMKDIYVTCKIMESTKNEDTKFAKNLTNYSNKQNKIIPTDFYSNKPEQNMLKNGLLKYDIDYITKRGKLISNQSKTSIKNRIKMDEMSEIIYWKENLFFKTSLIFREDKKEYEDIYNNIFGNNAIPDLNKIFEFSETFYLNNRLIENLNYIRSVVNNIEKIKNKSQQEKDTFIRENKNFSKFIKNKRYFEQVLNKNNEENESKNQNIEKNIFLIDKYILWYIFWSIYEVCEIESEDEIKKLRYEICDFLKSKNYLKINEIVDKLTPHIFSIYIKILERYQKESGVIKKLMYNKQVKNMIEEVIDECSSMDEYTIIKL